MASRNGKAAWAPGCVTASAAAAAAQAAASGSGRFSAKSDGKRTVKRIAGTDGINRLDPRRWHAPFVIARRHEASIGSQGDNDRPATLVEQAFGDHVPVRL